MRTILLWALLACSLGCSPSVRHVGEPARSRALAYQARADEQRRAGDRAGALHFATRALVVRLADCGFECPEVAYSFVTLGDLRHANGQEEHAAQSYARALEVLAPHRSTHADWIGAVELRLQAACARSRQPPPACRP